MATTTTVPDGTLLLSFRLCAELMAIRRALGAEALPLTLDQRRALTERLGRVLEGLEDPRDRDLLAGAG
ncbi:hypothetical protein D3879_22455 [Pseudomonas cavernicola]|uniref:Uncharacterized protein n=1 Tax=Pseudomonas cavernicola TaxID=2320866 RepID=A0A418X8D5_9PSED|nr:hypothetical protein [Pseudomonas cavernicola]RJG08658.1 hypothetical protein D3879_22455 [Pseudomonas cavernicola]